MVLFYSPEIFVKSMASFTKICRICFCTSSTRNKSISRKPIRVVDSYGNKKRIPTVPLNEMKAIYAHNEQTAMQLKNDTSLLPHNDGYFVPLPPYEKLQLNDERFTKILTLLKSRTTREKSGKLLLEGERLINDAIDAGVKLDTLFFSRETSLSKIKLHQAPGVKLFKVLYKSLQVWSSVTTSPGIMGVCKKPSPNEISVLTDPSIPVSIVGHNIHDPRIMGSVIRNAAAVGCQNLLFTKDCTDPWKQSVLRSACGAHFRIPIIDDIEWPYIENYIPKDSSFYIINTESNYKDDEFVDYAGELLDDGKEKHVVQESSNHMVVNESYLNEEHLEQYKPDVLSDVCYSDVCFPKSDIVLCVSENHSINDAKAIKLACEFGGNKLKIPVENNIELDVKIALPVILYEIRRQNTEEFVIQK